MGANNMDSVFANCTNDELKFDAMFDEDDCLIEMVAGVNEAGVPLTGEDFDWNTLNEAEDMVGENPDFDYQKDGDASGSEKDAEGTKDIKPEIGGEVGDGKEVSGKENSAESHADDVTKDIDNAIGANDKKQTTLESSEEGPLEDDDKAEREGEVPPTAVETESQDVVKADPNSNLPTQTGANAPKSSEEEVIKANESAPEITDGDTDISLAESIINSIKGRVIKETEEAQADTEMSPEDADAPVEAENESAPEPEVQSEETPEDAENVEENALLAKIREAREAKKLVREKKEYDELVNKVLESMSEEELANENVLDLVKEKVAAAKKETEVCPECGKAPCECANVSEAVLYEEVLSLLEFDAAATAKAIKDKVIGAIKNLIAKIKSFLSKHKDNSKASNLLTKSENMLTTATDSEDPDKLKKLADEVKDSVEVLKGIVEDENGKKVGKTTVAIAASANMVKESSDSISDDCDECKRSGKCNCDTKNVEGVSTDVLGASIVGDVNCDPIVDLDDEEARSGKTDKCSDEEGVKTHVVGAALESSDNIDDLLSDIDDDEIIDIEITDDVVPDKVKEDDSVNKIDLDIKNTNESVSDKKIKDDIVEDEEDIDIESIKNEPLPDSDLDITYDYDDEELIDITITED